MFLCVLTNHVIAEVVTHVQCLQPSKFVQFFVKIIKKLQKVFHGLFFVNAFEFFLFFRCELGARAKFFLAFGVAIDVLNEDRVTKGRPVVQMGTLVGVTTRPNLKIETNNSLCPLWYRGSVRGERHHRNGFWTIPVVVVVLDERRRRG